MPTYIKKCPECGGINLIFNKDRGEVICKDCGLVIEEKMIDFGQEWREFDNEQASSRRRAGAPMTYTKYDKGLGTDVGKKADIYSLSGKERNRFFRLRKWQMRISTAIERNLKLALAELKRVSSFLKLPKAVEEEAARIYTLLTNGSVVCLPNNEYLVPDYVLSVLVKRGIQFKMENNNGDKIKSSISNTPKI